MGTTAYILFKPLLTLLNLLVTLPVSATAILWTPLASTFVYLFNILIYDFERPSTTTFPWFPLPKVCTLQFFFYILN